jgi:hypothetical protein
MKMRDFRSFQNFGSLVLPQGAAEQHPYEYPAVSRGAYAIRPYGSHLALYTCRVASPLSPSARSSPAASAAQKAGTGSCVRKSALGVCAQHSETSGHPNEKRPPPGRYKDFPLRLTGLAR